MKATIEGVEVDGTPKELAEFINAIKADTNCSDVAMLSPKQREVYDALAHHPNGAHYEALATELGMPSGVVNTRLNKLVGIYSGKVVRRVCAGTFVVVR